MSRNWHIGRAGHPGEAVPISTRLTALLGVQHPILLAPMDLVSSGRLAAAVSRAAGFGIIGGGYGDEAWLAREMDAAGEVRVGVGFITWSMARQPRLLDLALERRPPAIMLSFGDVSSARGAHQAAPARGWTLSAISRLRLRLSSAWWAKPRSC